MAKKATKQRAASGRAAPLTNLTVVNLATIARLLMLTPRRVQQLCSEGWLPDVGRGEYPIDQCVWGYLKFLKDSERRSSKSAAATKLQSARLREIELRIAVEENRLIDIEDVQAVIGEAFGILRSVMAGVPAASTRDISLRREIEKHLNGAIDKCRERLEEAQRDHWADTQA